jgi:hypothetical protein
MGMNNPMRGVSARSYRSWAAERVQSNGMAQMSRMQTQRFENNSRSQLLGIMQVISAKKKAKEEEARQETFGIGGLMGAGGNLLGGAFRALDRPDKALAGGVIAAYEREDIREGIREGWLEQPEDTNFATLFEKMGVDGHTRNIAGLVADMVLSPWNVMALLPTPVQPFALGMATARIAGKLTMLDRMFRPGRPGDRAVGWIGKKVMRQLQPAILGDTSPYELKRNLRDLGLPGKQADEWIEEVRISRNLQTLGQQAAIREAIEGIRTHTAATALEAGKSGRQAKRTADEFVERLQKDEAFSKRLFMQFDHHAQKGSSWGDAERMMRDAANDELEQIGSAAAVRFMRSKFGRLDDGTMGTIAKLKNQYLGVTPRQQVYIRRWFPDASELSKAADFVPKLKERMSGSAYKRLMKGESEAFDTVKAVEEFGLESNFLSVVAHDIASTRLSAQINKIISPEWLKRMGGREVVMDAATVSKTQRLLRHAGVDPKKAAALLKQGLDAEQAAVQLLRRNLRDIPSETIDTLRRYADNMPGAGEAMYSPNASLLAHTSDEMVDIQKALGEIGVKSLPEKTWILPAEMARGLKLWKNPTQSAGVLGIIDGFNSIFKPFVTVLWPAFFVRNAEGLIHNMWFSGMGGRDILTNTMQSGLLQKGKTGGVLKQVGAEKRVQFRTKTGEFDMNYDEFITKMELDGALNAGARDVGQQMLTEAGALRDTSMLKRLAARIKGEQLHEREGMEMFKELVRVYDHGIMKRHKINLFAYGASLNQGMDNNAKIARMLHGLKNGETWEEAVRNTRKFLFDYTEAGRGTETFARAIPFLRWTRFSAPLMAEQLLLQPQKVQKIKALSQGYGNWAKDEHNEATTLEAEASTLPDWLQEKYHILLGRNSDGSQRVVYGLGLPIEDLNRLFAGGIPGSIESWMSDVTPIIRIPIEVGADHSFFTGEPIGRDNPELARFYSRSWGWIEDMPEAVGDGLRDWLQFERLEDPRTGNVRYRAGNPMAMYLFSSLVMRAGNETEKVRRIFDEPRDRGMSITNFLTGVKSGDFFDPAPSRVPLAQALRDNPFLRAKYAEYEAIPLYPQFGNPELSQTAVQALSGINAYRAFLRRAFPDANEADLFENAAQKYGENDPYGEVLARIVHQRSWKATGRKNRSAFLSLPQNLDLAAAVNQLDIVTAEQLVGSFLD